MKHLCFIRKEGKDFRVVCRDCGTVDKRGSVTEAEATASSHEGALTGADWRRRAFMRGEHGKHGRYILGGGEGS